MSVKLLGGVAKGMSLNVPKGETVRPTSVILKRKLFDSHQVWESFIFVDLCAGTGSMGIESWSRGASEVYLIESDPKVQKNLKNNIKQLEKKYPNLDNRPIHCLLKKSEVWVSEFLENYKDWEESKKERTVIFIDPPYKLHSVYFDIFEKIQKEFKGILWIESDRLSGISEKDASRYFDITKTYKHSDSFFWKVDLR